MNERARLLAIKFIIAHKEFIGKMPLEEYWQFYKNYYDYHKRLKRDDLAELLLERGIGVSIGETGTPIIDYIHKS